MDDFNQPDPEWVKNALLELESAGKEYEQEKLKQDLVMAISKMSHDDRIKLKQVMGELK